MSRSIRFISTSKKRLTLSAVVVVALIVAIGALAYFLSQGAGTGSASVGSLNAPAKPGAVANGTGRVDISWHQATLSNGTPAAKYYVSRYSGSTLDGYACGTSPTGTTVPASAADGSGNFSCSDTGLTNAGPYTYTVTAVYKSWTAESGKSDPVTVSLVGPLDHFVLAGTSPVTAGAADNLTITAKDASGNTVTSYTGDHSLTFTGAGNAPDGTHPTVADKAGTAVNFGTAETITFSNGVANVSGSSNGVMKLYKAGTANIVVSDGTISNGAGLAVTVTAAAANATQSTLTPTSASVTANGSTTQVLTVTAKDANGNNETSGGATATITRQSGSGTIGSVTDNGNGTYTATVTAPTATGSGVFVATLNGNPVKSGTGSQTQATITYVPGPVSQLAFTTQPGGASGGSAFTTQPVVTARDANGNTVTSYSGTVTLSIKAGTGTSGAALSGCTGTLTSGVTSFSGCKIDKAGGGYVLTASDGTRNVDSGAFAVSVGAAAQIVFTQQPSGSSFINVAFATQPKLTVEDAGGNTVTTDASTVTLTITSGTPASGGPGTLSGCTQSEASGVITFGGCKIDTAGTGYKLHAVDGSLPATDSNSFNVVAITQSLLASTLDTTGSSSSSTPSATTTNGATELILVYRDTSQNNETISGITGPFTGLTQVVAATGQPLTFTTTKGNHNLFVYRATGNGSTGQVTVTFSSNKNTVTVIDFVQLANNDTSAPIVQQPTATGTSATATATLTAPAAGDAELLFLGAAQTAGTSPAVQPATPAGFTLVDTKSAASTTNGTAGWGTLTAFDAAAQTSASSGLGASVNWGTIALEIKHA